MKRLHLWLILLVILGGGGAYAWFRAGARDVQTATVGIGPAVEFVYATGYVEPRRPVSVVARTTAPVRAVLVEEGEHVRRGQPLILLDDGEQRTLVDQAAATRVRAVLDERRAVTLFGQGWVTRAARDGAVASAASARAGEAATRARLDQMVVRSGIDGVVLKRDVQPGDLAAPSRVLLQVGDIRDLWVTATVDERDIPRLSVGQSALLKSDAWPGKVIRGRLVELTPGGNPDQRAFRVRIVPEAGPALPIGLTFEVNLTVREAQRAVLVPNAALRDGAVWKVVDRRAVRQPVETGIVGADMTEVRAGLAPGATVILNPPTDLRDGAPVAIGVPDAKR